MQYRVVLHPDRIAALAARGGPIDRAVEVAAGQVRDWGKAEIYTQQRVRTGKMAQQTVTEPLEVGPRVGSWWRVISRVPYSLYQHEGTRAHGPRNARVLRFQPKGSGVYVFAHRVRGVTPSKFLSTALHRLTPASFRRL